MHPTSSSFCLDRDQGHERNARLGTWCANSARGLACGKDVAAHWPSATGGLTGCVANWELGFNVESSADRGLDAKGTADTRWFQWPRGPHSAKPEAFLDLVEQVSAGPYVELFARRARFGWDYWGDESLGTAELAAEFPPSRGL